MICVIRVDSSSLIGSGHLMRCITLADKMKKKKNADVHFVCRDLEGNLSQLVVSHGHQLHLLPSVEKNNNLEGYAAWLTVSQERDAAETISILKEIIPDGKSLSRLVVDSYAIDIEWEQQLRPYTEEIFVIDDLANRHHDCDVLLDQNLSENMSRKYNGLLPENCQILIGPKYVLLRDEFIEARKQLKTRDGNINNVLVFYGGSDVTNETMKALVALSELVDYNYKLNIDVIVGGSNPHKKEIESYCKNKKYMHYYCQVNNMAEFMLKADLFIGAGGATTYERCYLRLPSIVTSIAENQRDGSEYFGRIGIFEYVGYMENIESIHIIEAVKKLMIKNKYFCIIKNMEKYFD